MKLLLVYPRAFANGWMGETPRMMHMARGLSALGWEIDLLRCKQPREDLAQPMIGAFPGRVWTTPFYGHFSAFMNRRGLRRGYTLWRRLCGHSRNEDFSEVLAARLVQWAGETGMQRPDVICGITVGHLMGPVAAQELSDYFRCPFVVEFRDPVPHPGGNPMPPQGRELLEDCLTHSALVLTTTEGIRQGIEKEFPAVQGKGQTLYSCFDDRVPLPTSEESDQEQLVLVHAGVLYGGRERNVRSLVAAIAEAVRTDASARGRIILRLIGAGKGGVEATTVAQELGISWAVELLPQMPPQDCLRQMDCAHVLVAVKFQDAEYDLQVPGKVFQYLGRGKPILGLMRETEAAEILRRSGLGVVVSNNDLAGISAALCDFWRHRDALPERFKPDWDYIRQFSSRAMAERLEQLLTSVLDPKQRVGQGQPTSAGRHEQSVPALGN